MGVGVGVGGEGFDGDWGVEQRWDEELGKGAGLIVAVRDCYAKYDASFQQRDLKYYSKLHSRHAYLSSALKQPSSSRIVRLYKLGVLVFLEDGGSTRLPYIYVTMPEFVLCGRRRHVQQPFRVSDSWWKIRRLRPERERGMSHSEENPTLRLWYTRRSPTFAGMDKLVNAHTYESASCALLSERLKSPPFLGKLCRCWRGGRRGGVLHGLKSFMV